MPRMLTAFIAGFFAVLLFHQPLVMLLSQAGLLPPGAAYSLDPVPPLGLYTFVSKAFWGGLWAILIDAILSRATGLTYWAGWIVIGAIALPLVAIFVVPVVKGQPPLSFVDRMPLYALINGFWGFGSAVLLLVLGRR